MPANRSMFWRILRRLISSNCGRLFVILLALGAGAAVSAALLNLQVDARHRLTSEFRSFGANVLITPRDAGFGATLDEHLLDLLPARDKNKNITAVAFLYVVARATAYDKSANVLDQGRSASVVVAGVRYLGSDPSHVLPHRVTEGSNVVILDTETCEIGQGVASRLRLHVTGTLQVMTGQAEDNCIVSEVQSFGGPEDSQVFLPLASVQHLANDAQRISLIQVNVPGTSKEIDRYIAALQRELPNVSVHPIRQFTEAQAKIYSRISGVLTATVVVVLLLTTLCVLAAMTNVAMERKQDVAMMKAIGGSARRVTHIFFAEAAILGLAGGLIGAAAGIALSIFLGKAVFGVAAQPRLIVYPASVALTLIVAILASYPLRHLASVKPASIFRGDA